LKEGILKRGYFGNVTLPQVLKVNNWAVIIPLAAMIVVMLYLLERAGY